MSNIILGIDPSTASTGWAIMDEEGNLISYGVVRCPSKHPIYIRLRMIYDGLIKVAEEYKVNQVAVEDQFLHKNPKTLKALSNVKGIAMLVAAQVEAGYFEYAPKVAKKCFADNSDASKEDMIAVAKKRYGIEEKIRNDIADAIGIAYTHKEIGGKSGKKE